jgi:thiol-disulfide isomerase/thioredoxin
MRIPRRCSSTAKRQRATSVQARWRHARGKVHRAGRAEVVVRFVAGACFAALFVVAACSRSDEPSSPSVPVATPPSLPPHVRFAETPPSGAVDALVRDALASAASEGHALVVYVGAPWCEPCQRFHQAAERGELDVTLPALTFLEFDYDRDAGRLAAAGYVSRYIPLFALPATDGRSSGKQLEGGIKGEGAVAYITPRLKELLVPPARRSDGER